MDGRVTRGDRALSNQGPRRWRSSAGLAVLSLAAALLAGCGAGDPAPRSTEPTPPDRLAVTVSGGGVPAFRIDLECAVADRDACVDVLAALTEAQSDDVCEPAPGGDGVIDVTGTIGGDVVEQRIDRRTDCQVRAYDAIIAGLGL